ncbi:MAG: hypothetical protein K6G22_08200 [Lachnospiraceae bacterium]|nr:hypothetical protein [Lachnospiraceae bacterium]
MKKAGIFLAKCLLALVPVLIMILYTALLPMGYMDTEYPSWKYTKDEQRGLFGAGEKGTQQEINTVIIGDSRAMADLIPEKLSDDTVNLAVGGATAIEMYHTLKDHFDNVGVPDTVIIMFAPFHYSYMDNFWTRTVYFHHLKIPDVIKLYTEGRRLKADAFYDGEHDLFDLISCYLYLPDSYLPALLNSKFFGRYETNRSEYDTIARNKGHGLFGTLDGCSDLNYEASYTEMKMDGDHPLIDLYMRKILDLCSENSVNIILSQPPMNETSYGALHGDYTSQYSEYINGLSSYYNGGIFETEIPEYENKYFGDSSHLNAAGAEIYTEDFAVRYGFR